MPQVKMYDNDKITMIECNPGAILSDILNLKHFHVALPCGGQGRCEKCTVDVNGRDVLACKYRVESNVEVRLNSIKKPNFGTINSAENGGSFGIAIDLGTTNISASLVDLKSNKIIETIEIINKQSAYGADVLSRVMNSRRSLQVMHETTSRQILEIKNAFKLSKFSPCIICGNSIMMHILANVDPAPLGAYPFEMKEFFGREIASDYLTRCVSSFIGGDILCGIFSTEMLTNRGNSLLVDIGTNTEIVLKYGDELIAASAPAGPAFEGVGLKMGMAASAGAINSVRLENDRVVYKTVENAPAIGICGSGIVDVIAVFRKLNLIDENGAINSEIESEYIAKYGDKIYLKFGDVIITCEDIQQIMLAKSAIRAAIDVVLNNRILETVYLAGEFGKHLNLQSALKVGLFPPDFAGKVQIVENAALTGAAKILCNKNLKAKSVEIAQKINVINLTENENFGQIFIENLRL